METNKEKCNHHLCISKNYICQKCGQDTRGDRNILHLPMDKEEHDKYECETCLENMRD